jgi:hypothetical protein
MADQPGAIDPAAAAGARWDAVAVARQSGYSWRAIGTVLGTSGEAARQRYGAASSESAADARDDDRQGRPGEQPHADDRLHDAIVRGLLPEPADWGLAFFERTSAHRGSKEILGSADVRLEIVADWLGRELDVTIRWKGVEDVTTSRSRLPRNVGRGVLTSHLRTVGRSLAANAG